METYFVNNQAGSLEERNVYSVNLQLWVLFRLYYWGNSKSGPYLLKTRHLPGSHLCTTTSSNSNSRSHIDDRTDDKLLCARIAATPSRPTPHHRPGFSTHQCVGLADAFYAKQNAATHFLTRKSTIRLDWPCRTWSKTLDNLFFGDILVDHFCDTRA